MTGMIDQNLSGLDSRFERVDNGQVEWYDLDLPEVIELRQKLVGGEGARYHLLKYSVLDQFEPRLARMRWIRFFSFLAKAAGIYHYRLGRA